MIRKFVLVVALVGLGLVVSADNASAGLFYRHGSYSYTVASDQCPSCCGPAQATTDSSQPVLSPEELAKIKKDAADEAAKQPVLSPEELAKIKKDAR